MSAFVTDSGYKHTLSIVRSLGHRRLTIDVGSSSHAITSSSTSRYVRKAFVYPDPKIQPFNFAKFIKSVHEKYRYRVIIPVGYNVTVALSKFKQSLLRDLNIPVADYLSLKIAANKLETIKLAENLGVSVPKTKHGLKNLDEVKDMHFPIVVKGVYESGYVRYAHSRDDLVKKLNEIYVLQGVFPLIQEFVRGEGYGFFALFNNGEPRRVFMHKRLREYPITGGASTCAISVYEPKLMEYGLKLLRALNWHGVAMVEFRKGSKGEFKLMEINPKFWGSLDLAIESGVDFPYLLYKMIVDGDVKPVFNYNVGVRFMWPFSDDLLHAVDQPRDLHAFIKDLIDAKVKKNIDIRDIKPNLLQFLQTTAVLGNKLVRRVKF